MSDQTPTSSFFTVEVIHGPDAELNDIACNIARLGVESVVALSRFQLLNREHAPEVKIHKPGPVQA